MHQKSNALASYGRIANSETNPLKQIVMLYDGAIKFLNLTASAIEAEDFIAKAEIFQSCFRYYQLFAINFRFRARRRYGADFGRSLSESYTIGSARERRMRCRFNAPFSRIARSGARRLGNEFAFAICADRRGCRRNCARSVIYQFLAGCRQLIETKLSSALLPEKLQSLCPVPKKSSINPIR